MTRDTAGTAKRYFIVLVLMDTTETIRSVCMSQLSKKIYRNRNFVEMYTGALKDDKFHQFEDKPAIHKMLGSVRGKRVLCIGCGNGNECAYIKKKGAKEVIGVDLSKSMIKKAKIKHKGIKFLLCLLPNWDLGATSSTCYMRISFFTI